MINVCLIGCGNIGKRHLQAVLKIDNINIEVVEPNINSIELTNDLLPDFKNYFHNIDDISDDIDVCIISTKSDIRKKIILELVDKKNVKNIIIEKIAFQSNEDFEDVINLLDTNKINCWVNCHLRAEPVWNRVKEIIDGRKIDIIYDIAEDDGLISTGIHILDLFCYLTNQSDYSLDFINISDKILESKHKGYIELDSDIFAKNKNKDTLLIKRNNNKIYHNCVIKTDIDKILIKHTSKNGDNSWEDPICILEYKDKEVFSFLWQSELTNLYIEDILKNKKCKLPSLQESFSIHKELINSVNEIFGEKFEKCPIT